jgi:hypothetical protein
LREDEEVAVGKEEQEEEVKGSKMAKFILAMVVVQKQERI